MKRKKLPSSSRKKSRKSSRKKSRKSSRKSSRLQPRTPVSSNEVEPPCLIERFVDDVKPANPDLCREVLGVALARPYPAHETDGVGFWSFFTTAAIDVYTDVCTAGSGTGHTYRLLERWFRWLGDVGEIPAFDVALSLFELELARRSHVGMKPRYMRLPSHDGMSGVELGARFTILRGPPGLERFLDGLDSDERVVAEFAARNVVRWLAEHRGAPIQFEDFDVDDYFAALLDFAARGTSLVRVLHQVANYLEGRASDDAVRKTRELALSVALSDCDAA